jgi:guanine deaminase
MENHEHYFSVAFALAFETVRNNNGGPFGAVVVKDGKIIGKGSNHVISDNDPTAHAEIVAIRDACRNLNTFDLAGAEIYATCEPCPMCFSAVYWSNIRSVYYASTRFDAENAGFRDHHIYEEIAKSPHQTRVAFHYLPVPEGEQLFREWKAKTDKTLY